MPSPTGRDAISSSFELLGLDSSASQGGQDLSGKVIMPEIKNFISLGKN